MKFQLLSGIIAIILTLSTSQTLAHGEQNPNKPKTSKTKSVVSGPEATPKPKPIIKKPVPAPAPKPQTFTATSFLTNQTSKFGPGIEGAAVNTAGNLFAVNFNKEEFHIGQANPEQKCFFRGDATNFFNAIRFIPSGKKDVDIALVGDVKSHAVLQLTSEANGNVTKKVFCQDPKILQPNDLAVTKSGRVYLSGQNFTADTKVGDGDLWLCDKAGKAKRLGIFGRTNGIEVSPDERTLYLSEAFNKNGTVISNKILKFKLNKKTGGIIGKPQIFVDFGKFDKTQAIDIDGIRADIEGNLYVTRNGAGEVKKFSPKGVLLATIKLSFTNPTNLELGGPKGTDLFVVGKCNVNDTPQGCVDVLKGQKRPGKAITILRSGHP
ncbi:hypothetical protein G9A89_008258 [Geosiphon pyriformis]|nr:hypothetical protein G9A89_008258 [Geosiphon pyriformis]